MGHWKTFAIFVWHARADGPSAQEAVEFGNLLMHQHALFIPLHIVEESAGLPTPEGREGLLAPARKYHDRTACVGVLLPEAHIIAAMMRVFVRTARVMLHGVIEIVVEPGLSRLIAEVLKIHERRTGERIDPGQLLAAIEAVRRLPV